MSAKTILKERIPGMNNRNSCDPVNFACVSGHLYVKNMYISRLCHRWMDDSGFVALLTS